MGKVAGAGWGQWTTDGAESLCPWEMLSALRTGWDLAESCPWGLSSAWTEDRTRTSLRETTPLQQTLPGGHCWPVPMPCWVMLSGAAWDGAHSSLLPALNQAGRGEEGGKRWRSRGRRDPVLAPGDTTVPCGHASVPGTDVPPRSEQGSAGEGLRSDTVCPSSSLPALLPSVGRARRAHGEWGGPHAMHCLPCEQCSGYT